MLSDWISKSLTHMAVLKDQKLALEMALRPSYEKVINEQVHVRYFPLGGGMPYILPFKGGMGTNIRAPCILADSWDKMGVIEGTRKRSGKAQSRKRSGKVSGKGSRKRSRNASRKGLARAR